MAWNKKKHKEARQLIDTHLLMRDMLDEIEQLEALVNKWILKYKELHEEMTKLTSPGEHHE